MGHWGVKSFENDDAADALDAGFDCVHGATYEALMDDRNPLSPDQVQKQLASSETLAAAIAALEDAVGQPLDAWDETLGGGADLVAAASAALAAAENGRDSTEPIVARKGRASYLGERSAGHIDPGATSTALLFQALADTLKG